jgi:3-hydroxybutyryl-CoA dehydratase
MNVYEWGDLKVGLAQGFDVTVSEKMLLGFLEQTGDTNPLHVDAEYARSRGFEDRVVYGLLTSSFYSTLVGVHLPGRNALLQGLNITFQKPVYVGVRLRVSGEIKFMSDAYRRLEIAGSITSNGEHLSKAKILVGVL